MPSGKPKNNTGYNPGQTYGGDFGLTSFDTFLEYYRKFYNLPVDMPLSEVQAKFNLDYNENPEEMTKMVNDFGAANNVEPLKNAKLDDVKTWIDTKNSYQFGDQTNFVDKETGQYLYKNIQKVLEDKSGEFSEWKKANPGFEEDAKAFLKAYKTEKGADIGAAAMSVGVDVAKLAFSIGQIKQAKRMKNPLPKYPDNLPVNQDLVSRLGTATLEASRGFSEAERAKANKALLLDYEKRKADARETGAYSTNVATLLRNQRSADIAGLGIASESLKASKAQIADNLLKEKMLEDYRRYQHSVGKFAALDYPAWVARENAKAQLLGAGIQNTFSSLDNLIGDVSAGAKTITANNQPLSYETAVDNTGYNSLSKLSGYEIDTTTGKLVPRATGARAVVAPVGNPNEFFDNRPPNMMAAQPIDPERPYLPSTEAMQRERDVMNYYASQTQLKPPAVIPQDEYINFGANGGPRNDMGGGYYPTVTNPYQLTPTLEIPRHISRDSYLFKPPGKTFIPEIDNYLQNYGY